MQNGLRTYRPSLSDYIYCSDSVQDKIMTWLTKLSNQQATRSLLITGPAGHGKTTLAQGLCDQLGIKPRDIHEINCANLRTLEDARDLIGSALQYQPSSSPYRILILDECHQMLPNAQQAFLTPLEKLSESHIVIACTTDPSKLVKPFYNRFYEIKLDTYTEERIVEILSNLPDSNLTAEQMVLIAQNCDLNPRVAIGMAEQGITEQDAKTLQEQATTVQQVIGLVVSQNPAVLLKLSQLRSDQVDALVTQGCGLLEKLFLKIRGTLPAMSAAEREAIDNIRKTSVLSPSQIAEVFGDLQNCYGGHPNKVRHWAMKTISLPPPILK